MMKKALMASLLVPFALVFQAIRPPPPKICSSPGDPSVTQIKLRDGRYLAYEEYGVSKEISNYKVVYVHSFGASKFEAALITSPKLLEELRVHLVCFERPGYGKSDPHPNRNLKSLALDVEGLADQLELGTKFYVMGLSMGGHLVWGCLKYIPERLAGAALFAPVINYWWPGFPSNLTKQALKEQLLKTNGFIKLHTMPPGLCIGGTLNNGFLPSVLLLENSYYLSKIGKFSPNLIRCYFERRMLDNKGNLSLSIKT